MASDTACRTLLWSASRGIPLRGPSGASAHLRGVAAALVRRGHQVLVATPLAADERGVYDADDGLRAVHLDGGRWPNGLRTFGSRLDGHRLWRRATHYRPDIVWERHEPASLAAARWCRWRGIPRLVELNAPLSLERRWPREPRPGLLAREVSALQSADRVVAVSQWLADWAVHLGCDPGRVRHVPNGVPPQAKGDRIGARSVLGVSDRFVVGFVGSLHAGHDLQRLPAWLDAMPDAIAIVAGPTDRVPVHARVVALGQVSERNLPHVVSAMDVAVAPLTSDAPPWYCPLKIYAYRAQGVPVVATIGGDAASAVGKYGLCLPMQADDDSWVDAICAAALLPRIAAVRPWDDVVDEATTGLF